MRFRLLLLSCVFVCVAAGCESEKGVMLPPSPTLRGDVESEREAIIEENMQTPLPRFLPIIDSDVTVDTLIIGGNEMQVVTVTEKPAPVSVSTDTARNVTDTAIKL